jgi:hypothetical protein
MNNKINKYNKKQLKYINNIINIKNKYNIKFNNNDLCIYLDNKLIIAGEFNFYGIYQQNTNLWIWASSIPGVNKKHLNFIKKIKNMDYLFEKSSDIRSDFYYQLLTQDVIFIKNEKLLEWINELLLYLSNDIFYFNPINNDNNIQFLTLSNIKEKYI